MIEGGLNLQRLDFLKQKHAAKLTRQFLQTLLSPAWFRTESVVAHAKRFFPDFVADGVENIESLKMALDKSDSSLADYFCFLMLDFVTVDRDLGDVALSAAIVLSRRIGFETRFAELVQKELALGKKAFARIDKAAEALLAKTGAAHST